MNRIKIPTLLFCATAFFLLVPAESADAYDGYFNNRLIDSPCGGGDYFYRPGVYLPSNRYQCGYEQRQDFRRWQGRCDYYDRFRPADRFAPGRPLPSPAPGRYGFQQPNIRREAPQNPGRDDQMDPFEKFAPDRSRSPRGNRSPELPTMELPPSLSGNGKEESPPESRSGSHGHSHSHDHGNSGSGHPSAESDRNREENNREKPPALPRISPPPAQLLVPSGS